MRMRPNETNKYEKIPHATNKAILHLLNYIVFAVHFSLRTAIDTRVRRARAQWTGSNNTNSYNNWAVNGVARSSYFFLFLVVIDFVKFSISSSIPIRGDRLDCILYARVDVRQEAMKSPNTIPIFCCASFSEASIHSRLVIKMEWWKFYEFVLFHIFLG